MVSSLLYHLPTQWASCSSYKFPHLSDLIRASSETSGRTSSPSSHRTSAADAERSELRKTERSSDAEPSPSTCLNNNTHILITQVGEHTSSSRTESPSSVFPSDSLIFNKKFWTCSVNFCTKLPQTGSKVTVTLASPCEDTLGQQQPITAEGRPVDRGDIIWLGSGNKPTLMSNQSVHLSVSTVTASLCTVVTWLLVYTCSSKHIQIFRGGGIVFSTAVKSGSMCVHLLIKELL